MQPPKSIWHSPKKCEDWIKSKMKGDKTGNNTGSNMLDIEEWERE